MREGQSQWSCDGVAVVVVAAVAVAAVVVAAAAAFGAVPGPIIQLDTAGPE